MLLKRFGSFPAALAAAGLRHAPHANTWTEEDYLQNLRQVWAHYGRAPTAAEMGRPPSRISVWTATSAGTGRGRRPSGPCASDSGEGQIAWQ